MMIVYKYDEQGYFVEPVLLKENQAIPSNCTDVPLPEVNYKPRFVDGQWVETMTVEEIENELNIPMPLSPLEELKKQQTDLIFDLMLKGVL